MNKIERAINFYNEENFSQAEKLALEIFNSDNNSIDALDILSAIYLKENRLNLLDNLNKSHLILVRKIAGFLADLKTYEQAIFFYRKAIALEPDDAVGMNNIALLYEELNDFENARKFYEKSIRIKENYPALYNLGVLERKMKNLGQSKNFLKKAIALEPNNSYANYSLGMTYLMEKDFQEGYKYFLKRPIKNTQGLKNFWDGSIQKDKIILVFCEYGLGDAIMFSRYFSLLKEYFSKIKVFCSPSLHSIFNASFNGIEFVSSPDTEYDFCVFAMNLPYFLNIDFLNIPLSDGYLNADETKVLVYKEKYFNNEKKKIGIFYVGGELEKRNAKYRRIALERFAEFFNIPDTIFYSFQKDDVFGELQDFPEVIDLGKIFNDFSDTAAAMKNLDLFITIDSAPAHLAGALGIKTFLMLPYFSEWRWFLDEKHTPWYNSVELIRQTTPCNWQSVVEKIYEKLIH